MRRTVRWFVVTVLMLDVAVAVVLLTGVVPTTAALSAESDPDAGTETVSDKDALLRLGRELAERAADLDRRETELEELLRGREVLERAGIPIAGLDGAFLEPAGVTPETAAAIPEGAPRQNEAFLRLQRAYENMEPDSAAKALAELTSRDKDAVVELLIGWKPRTSGAVLDAIAQADPVLAADLSYEVWKRSGKAGASAASSGR